MCTHTPTQSVLPNQLVADPQGNYLLGVPVTQPMVDLLCGIFDRTNDLKGSTANQVVRMWPVHLNQFGTFQTTMSESDREVLHIIDVKTIQNRISTSSKEKALHAAAENKVLQDQAPVSEANSAVVDLAGFNAKARISAALQHVKDAESALHDLEYPPQGLTRSLCKATESLEEGWHQWMASVDLKDTYFHIRVVAAHHQFLRFSWQGTSYQFRIFPFGLSSAPRVFTDSGSSHSVAQTPDSPAICLPRQPPDNRGVRGRGGPVRPEDYSNLKKSQLIPTQDLVYIGAWFLMDLRRLYLPEIQ